MLGIQPKFQTCEKKKNRENKMSKEKQSHAQDSIYIVRQFSLCPQSCRDFTIIKENYNMRLQCFSFSKITTRQNPNHKKKGFYILRTGFTMGYKTGQKFFVGLNLRSMD